MTTEARIESEEKEVEQLMKKQEIVQQIANKIIGSIVYPEFDGGNVPVPAKALGSRKERRAVNWAIKKRVIHSLLP